MRIFKDTKYDFLRWRWHAIAISLLVVAAGVTSITGRGVPMGVEFAGGTVVIAGFDEQPTIEQVRGALGSSFSGQTVVVQTYGEPALRQVMIRVPEVGEEAGNQLGSAAVKVQEALQAANLGDFEVVGTEIVGPAVGQELTSKGISATVLSLVGILLYLTFRYQLSFAVGAVAATIHDLVIVFSFLSFFQVDLTLNVIAAVLTVAGYSSNDTIVVFDRVRENLRSMRRDALKEVINVSINQTLGRTLITSGTTLFSALALFVFGGEVLRGFAFVLMVGVVTGTYSSVFIAAAIVTFWRGKGPAKAASRGAAPAAAGSPNQPRRRSRSPRKARAS